MKKIAILLYDYTLFGGAEHVAVNLANALLQDYEVNLISCFASRQDASFALKKEVSVHVLSSDTVSITMHAHRLAKRLKSILSENSIDVLLNITAGVNSIAWIASRSTLVKVVYCEHSNLANKTYGKKHQFRQWLGARTADKVVALTEADKSEFRSKYGIGDKALAIYNWYDGPVSRNYDPASRRMIAVGRLESIKGYDRMLDAMVPVFKKHPDWALDIYGEGSCQDTIQNRIDELHLENNIILKGNCPTVLEEYRSHSFCVMTSYYEGFALVLVEAMAQAIPAVSFDCPTGPREIIADGQNGYLVENGNVQAFSDAVNCLIEDTSLRKSFSSHTFECLKKFSKEQIYRQWVNLIEQLTESR